MEPDQVVAEANPTVGRPGTPWEGALALSHDSRETGLIDVQEVFNLTDW